MGNRLNKQLVTWATEDKARLHSALLESPVPSPGDGEILVEILAVPLHGSFWLATHPDGIHPRRHEFLSEGRFVFGNGGVGRVMESTHDGPRSGDYVAIFGHVPCARADCRPCRVEHRYVECAYDEATILGHGKGARDGTLARYAVLPRYSYETCFVANERPTLQALLPFMYAFLLADVRNALTRHPDLAPRTRLLLFGAGQSGHLAAWLHLHAGPEPRIVVVDQSPERTASIGSIRPGAVAGYNPPNEVVAALNHDSMDPRRHPAVQAASERIASIMHGHFNGQLADLLFDASSGNTAPLWDTPVVLPPGGRCIPFGFGSRGIVLSPSVLQRSGLSLVTSRGVGDLANRREVIELLRGNTGAFVRRALIDPSRRLESLEAALDFVLEQHRSSAGLHSIPHAFVTPAT